MRKMWVESPPEASYLVKHFDFLNLNIFYISIKHNN